MLKIDIVSSKDQQKIYIGMGFFYNNKHDYKITFLYIYLLVISLIGAFGKQ